ncbi:hypothetical protein HYPSUDRAFT_961010 [Hypholoma sublateritium FD-334 SS-4]|uniref:Uncharacterized protein n=1 Tax=Hypholoma sublateritium (strain FD-334 SS-4) TaxID=945553 RepID=A0A0D2KUK3_HYPSF|nr:hypothetical protein HYPSUDRAFT_961010 [Hypholoma sublateritium FD-334 SS-4]
MGRGTQALFGGDGHAVGWWTLSSARISSEGLYGAQVNGLLRKTSRTGTVGQTNEFQGDIVRASLPRGAGADNLPVCSGNIFRDRVSSRIPLVQVCIVDRGVRIAPSPAPCVSRCYKRSPKSMRKGRYPPSRHQHEQHPSTSRFKQHSNPTMGTQGVVIDLNMDISPDHEKSTNKSDFNKVCT